MSCLYHKEYNYTALSLWVPVRMASGTLSLFRAMCFKTVKYVHPGGAGRPRVQKGGFMRKIKGQGV